MASRLKLKKKKYHPPLKESPKGLHTQCNKTTELPEKINMKTYSEITSSSSQSNTAKEPIRTNIKSYADIAKSRNKIKTTQEPNTNTYAKNSSSSTQMFDENEIFTKAINSAEKHSIKLQPGRKDRGYGNCVFEAVINNINDRDCFRDKLVQTPNWYRRNWMAQMMQRIITGTCPWNPG